MEAHLVHATQADGVKQLGQICAGVMTAVSLNTTMAEHLANLGYIERLLSDSATVTHLHGKKALLKFLAVLSLHSKTACDRFARDGVGADALREMFEAPGTSELLQAEVLNTMCSLLTGSSDAVHMDLTTQLEDSGWVELMFDQVLDTKHASAPLHVAAVGVVKAMLKDRDPGTVGAVKKRLNSYPQWREYASSDHSLFVPTETVDDIRADVLLLEGGEDTAPAPAPVPAPASVASAPVAEAAATDDLDESM